MTGTDYYSALSPTGNDLEAQTDFPALGTVETERLMQTIRADLGSRYDMRGYLGRGGFATVWLAYDSIARELVAVKRFERLPNVRRTFYRELSAMFRLSHPNVVRIINLMEAAGSARYLILEYCAGGSLRAAFGRPVPARPIFPLEQIGHLARQLTEGLAAAHRLGLAHRDLKPENVLFAKTGDRLAPASGLIKLADFGLARALESATSADEAGRLRALSGSPAYMAPEQFAGSFTKATDIYALGVILYELLHGQPPFDGSPETIAGHHLQSAPKIGQHLPDAWRALLIAMLAKDSSQRPSTDILLEMLQKIRETESRETPNAPSPIAPVPTALRMRSVKTPPVLRSQRLTAAPLGLFSPPAGGPIVAVTPQEVLRVTPEKACAEPVPLPGVNLVEHGPSGELWLSQNNRVFRWGPKRDLEPILTEDGAIAALAPPLTSADEWYAVVANQELRWYALGESRPRRTVPIRTGGMRPTSLRLNGGGIAIAEGPIRPRLTILAPEQSSPVTVKLPGLCWALGRWPGAAGLFALVLRVGTGFDAFHIHSETCSARPLAEAPGLVHLAAGPTGPLYGLCASGEVVCWNEAGKMVGRSQRATAASVYTGFATDGHTFAVTARTENDYWLHTWTI